MAEHLNVKVKEVIKQTDDAVQVVFDVANEFTYKAGQFITLIEEIDGKEERRSYSLCSTPNFDAAPSIAVKRVEGGRMSNFVNDEYKAGKEVKILPAMGNFFIETDSKEQRHVVLIGGGSGITPLFGILKEVLENEPASLVSLIYANRDENSIIFRKELSKSKEKYGDRLRVVHHFDMPVDKEKKKGGLFGKIFKKSDRPVFLNQNAITEILQKLSIEPEDKNLFYICGPRPLMNTAKDALKTFGVSDAYIKIESFTADTVALDADAKAAEAESPAPSGGYEVTVRNGDEEHKYKVGSEKSILITGLEMGLDLPFSCQSGLCTACMGKCVSGKVTMKGGEGLSPEQEAEGYVLTCVGYPASDDVIIEIE